LTPFDPTLLRRPEDLLLPGDRRERAAPSLPRARKGSSLILLAVLLAWGGSLTAQQPRELSSRVQAMVAVDEPLVALRHVRLADGTGSPAREDQTVILREGRIEAVGPDREVSIPRGARVLELDGHTVIPGLVSLHEHTYFGGLRRTAPLNAGAPLYLAFGVTTGMTAGSQFPYQELNLKRAIDAGVMAGPRLHVSGPYLAGGPATTGNFRILADAEEARRVVSYWADEGATWVKFMSGPRELLAAVIQEAHARGVRVTGHLCSITFTEAAALGIDALQHGFITNSDYVEGKQPDVCPPENMRVQADVEVDSEQVRESIRRIVAHGAAVVSTLGVYETFVPERAYLDPRAMEFLAPEVREEVEANHREVQDGGPFRVPPRLLERMMEWERAFVDAGGLLGAGSDPWGTGYLPGFGNLRNYEMLVEAGFTPEEAIRILTLNGAMILGEESEIGSVESGKRADIVVIEGDPLADPSGIYEVRLVFKDGIGYDSEALRNSVRGQVGRF
jgi:imidazolonepropionase-like amidohydrolase